ncbi:hypothetical protein Q3G72_008929 [Acer saccharum]|nr:hypothetical protein Q3G72_008929 [Acer saccharum]
MPEPTSAKEWKSFLGKASYLRRFLPGLAALSASLMELLKKKVEYKWEEVHRQSLCENKGDLSERPSDDGSNSCPIGKDSAMVVTAVRILHRMCHSKSDKGASFCRSTGPSKDPIELSIPGFNMWYSLLPEVIMTLPAYNCYEVILNPEQCIRIPLSAPPAAPIASDEPSEVVLDRGIRPNLICAPGASDDSMILSPSREDTLRGWITWGSAWRSRGLLISVDRFLKGQQGTGNGGELSDPGGGVGPVSPSSSHPYLDNGEGDPKLSISNYTFQSHPRSSSPMRLPSALKAASDSRSSGVKSLSGIPGLFSCCSGERSFIGEGDVALLIREQLPFLFASTIDQNRGNKATLLRSPDRVIGLAGATRQISRTRTFGLSEAMAFAYVKDSRFVLLTCLPLGLGVWSLLFIVIVTPEMGHLLDLYKAQQQLLETTGATLSDEGSYPPARARSTLTVDLPSY